MITDVTVFEIDELNVTEVPAMFATVPKYLLLESVTLSPTPTDAATEESLKTIVVFPLVVVLEVTPTDTVELPTVPTAVASGDVKVTVTVPVVVTASLKTTSIVPATVPVFTSVTVELSAIPVPVTAVPICRVYVPTESVTVYTVTQ